MLSSHGQLVQGMCGSTNLCEYCAKRKAVENTEMLTLDALDGNAPELWCVLGTSIATLDMSVFYAARKEVFRRVRERWPGAQYASLLEYTTGYGPRAGGERRPHFNVLFKGVPAAAKHRLRKVVVDAWCDNLNRQKAGAASKRRQYVGEISHAGGLMRYVAEHFNKASQAPPDGFGGQRFSYSRGYFPQGGTAAREAAREALWSKRVIHNALEQGFDAYQANDLLDEARELREQTTWRLYDEPTPQEADRPVVGGWLMIRHADRYRRGYMRDPGPAVLDDRDVLDDVAGMADPIYRRPARQFPVRYWFPPDSLRLDGASVALRPAL